MDRAVDPIPVGQREAPRHAGPRVALDPLGLTLGRYLLTGDESAMEEVVAATRPRLLAVAKRIAGADDAEDAVQAAYLSLVRKRGAPLDAPVLPWLVTAVVRSAYRRRALARRFVSLADRLALAPDEGRDGPRVPADARPVDAVARRSHDAAAEVARLRDCVHRLPSRYRDAVVLVDLHGVPVPEAARLLGLSAAGVRTRLCRARALVRTRLLARAAATAVALPLFLLDRLREGGVVSALVLGGAMTVPAVAATTVVALALGVLAGRSLLAPSPTAESERVERLVSEVNDLKARTSALAEERDQLSRDLVSARGQALAASLPRPAPASVDTPTPATGGPAEPVAASEAAKKAVPAGRVAVPGFEDLVAEVDWDTVGKNSFEMAPLLPALFDEWAKAGRPSPRTVAQVQKLNNGLIAAAIAAAAKLDLPMMAANRAYTHPSFMVNAMLATLEAAGRPLSETQTAELLRLAIDATAALKAREASYGPTTWALQKLLDESVEKERFFDAAFARLTPAQRETLVPEAARGRLQADLFSSGLLWAVYAQVLPFDTPEQLSTLVSGSVLDLMGWGEERRTAVHDVVVAWQRDLPTTMLERPADPLSLVGMVPLASVHEAARLELVLLARLAETLALDEEGLTAIRQIERVAVPLRRPAK